MVDRRPPSPQKPELLKLLAEAQKQQGFKETLLALAEGKDPSLQMGAEVLAGMQDKGLLNEFANWVIHPKSGIIPFTKEKVEVKAEEKRKGPPPEIEKAMEPFIKEVNAEVDRLFKEKRYENMDRSEFLRTVGRAGKYGALGGALGATSGLRAREKRIEKIATASIAGFFLGAVGGLAADIMDHPMLPVGKLRMKVSYPARRYVDIDKVTQAAAKALEEFYRQHDMFPAPDVPQR